jgi:hypothetical protein
MFEKYKSLNDIVSLIENSYDEKFVDITEAFFCEGINTVVEIKGRVIKISSDKIWTEELLDILNFMDRYENFHIIIKSSKVHIEHKTGLMFPYIELIQVSIDHSLNFKQTLEFLNKLDMANKNIRIIAENSGNKWLVKVDYNNPKGKFSFEYYDSKREIRYSTAADKIKSFGTELFTYEEKMHLTSPNLGKMVIKQSKKEGTLF